MNQLILITAFFILLSPIGTSLHAMQNESLPDSCPLNLLSDELIVLIAKDIVKIKSYNNLNSRQKKIAVEDLRAFLHATVGFRSDTIHKVFISLCSGCNAAFSKLEYECKIFFSIEELQDLFKKDYGYKSNGEIFLEDCAYVCDRSLEIAQATPAVLQRAHQTIQGIGPTEPHLNCFFRGATCSGSFFICFSAMLNLVIKYPKTEKIAPCFVIPCLYFMMNDAPRLTSIERGISWWSGALAGGYFVISNIRKLRDYYAFNITKR
jgi:hypothetical protein